MPFITPSSISQPLCITRASTVLRNQALYHCADPACYHLTAPLHAWLATTMTSFHHAGLASIPTRQHRVGSRKSNHRPFSVRASAAWLHTMGGRSSINVTVGTECRPVQLQHSSLHSLFVVPHCVVVTWSRVKLIDVRPQV